MGILYEYDSVCRSEIEPVRGRFGAAESVVSRAAKAESENFPLGEEKVKRSDESATGSGRVAESIVR